MTAAQIFISYRRDDSAGYARAIGDDLARNFGAQRVFIDVDDIGAGRAFDEAIAQAMGASKVLLVLIGPRWLGLREGRAPRIDDPGDFVHQEVAAGLAHGLRVIPLLLDGAAMPGEAQLPAPLRALARRQALAIDPGRYAGDMARLVGTLREALADTTAAPAPGAGAPAAHPPSASPGARAGRIAAALAVLVGLAALWGGWGGAGRPDSPGPASVVATAGPRAAVNGRWVAEVVYDWPNARYTEHFDLAGEGGALHGSASFLRVARGILEGRIEGESLSFVTRTREVAGGDGPGVEAVHRYRGRLAQGAQGDELHFVMQSEGGLSTHRPVEFMARRSPP